MKRLLVPLVALVALATGCNALGGDVAATVEGTDITFAQVRQLAAAFAVSQNQPVASTSNAVDGKQGRAALSQWIELEAIHHEFVRRHASLGANDRSQAKSAIGQLKRLSGETKQHLIDLYAEYIAMQSVLGTSKPPPAVVEPTDAEVAAKAAELIASIPPDQLNVSCSNAIAGPVAAADQVQALLDGGTAITDPSAFSALQYSPPSGTNPLCVSLAQLPTELQGPYGSTAVGKLGRANFAAKQGGAVDSTLFFVPTGPHTLSATDADVVAAARQQLEQAAQSASQQATSASQGQLRSEFEKVVRRSDVDVDSRFGTLRPDGAIAPPLAPKPAASATTTVAPAATASSGAGGSSAASAPSS